VLTSEQPESARHALLLVEGLTVFRGGKAVVENVSFVAAPGDLVALVGPNGAGKSSLFNLITGDLKPDAGHIRLNGVDITRKTPHERCWAGIARSYQIPYPFENLTVFENLLVGAVYGRRRHESEAADHCAEILARTRLMHRANDRAGSLTLLERKRLELARALATDPQLLLLDEIAGGLTEVECQELIETIRAINAGGTTIIWIEHVVYALLAVVRRLVVLNFGRKIAEGDPQTVMHSQEVREIYTGIET
jgi:branched-chain amino acid transport system ATP-binding protein